MGTLQKHFDLESSKENPNTLLLSILSTILERNTLTFNEWRLLGKFIPKKEFLDNNPYDTVLASCVEVIQYPGGEFIQVMESGTFRYNSKIHNKDLDTAEKSMWKAICEKLWCENCLKNIK